MESGDVRALAGRLRAAGCVFAEDEARLLLGEAASEDELEARVERRLAGEPLEQVLGWAAFCGRRILLAPGVFVPRRRTELLVREAVRLERERRAVGGAGSTVVVDLCCGSGAVAVALADRLGPDAEVHAVDVEPVAVACARRNLSDVRGASVHEGDLYAPLPSDLRGRVQLLTCNAPYVPTAEVALMPTEARDHELPTSLDGGADGLDVLRRVVASAAGWLATDGTLLVEASRQQVRLLAAAMTAAGLVAASRHDPEADATVVTAAPRRPPRSAGSS